jgi:hypothetical protein
MDIRVLLTLAGAAVGLVVGILWLPPELPAPPPVREVELMTPIIEPIPPGHRGTLLQENGTPASGITVHFTRLTPGPITWPGRFHPTSRTNHVGQFAIDVPPGWYRVQALRGGTSAIDQLIEIPEGPHPDLELQLARVELLHFLGAATLAKNPEGTPAVP